MAEHETINLFEVTINTDQAVQDTIKLKEEVAMLTAETKRLKEQQGELSEEYVKSNAALKGAQSELREQEKVLVQLTAAEKEEGTTMKTLLARNAELRKERNNTNIETKEGRDRIKEINAEMDKNTETIKENSDAAKKQAMNVGNYKSALEGIPGATGQVVKGFYDMAAGAKAFILTPIGAILAVITGAFTLLYKALTSTEGGMNKLNKVGAIFSGVFDGIMKVLQPVANFLIDVVIVTFEKLGNVASGAINLISKGLAVLGFENAAAAVDNFNKSIQESVKGSIELSEAQAELVKQQREAQKIQLDYQKQAEKLRQIRDDESKSLKERKQANEDLNKTLQEQLKAELEIANNALKVAELRIKLEGESTAALDEKATALTTISDERIFITLSSILPSVSLFSRAYNVAPAINGEVAWLAFIFPRAPASFALSVAALTSF